MTLRETAKQKLIESSEKKRYDQNRQFMSDLLGSVRQHRLFRHDVLPAMETAQMNGEALVDMHLDFRVLTKQFTDVILMAQFLTREINHRHNEDHMPARFLINLNLLDELGFWPGHGEYLGDPDRSHFRLFEQVVDAMGVSRRGRDDRDHISSVALALLDFVEDGMNDFLTLLLYLVIAEEVALVYSPIMRRAVELYGLDVASGYYNVHGSSEDEDSDAEDDEHQNDAIMILCQYLQRADYPRARKLALEFCDGWAAFWDHQYARCAEVRLSA